MWKTLYHMFLIFSKRERIVFVVCCIAFIASALYIAHYILNKVTQLVPDFGGSYTEGIVGQVAFANPILARDGSVDAELASLLFASVSDLAESIKYSSDFKTWTVRLKEHITWSDQTPITTHDIIFTVQLIQNPDVLSPLADDWQHIRAIYSSEREIEFRLSQSYASFDTILKSLRPIPKHIFESTAPAHIRLSKYNFEPIASGPFAFVRAHIDDDGFVSSYELDRNDAYQTIQHAPYLDSFTLRFFKQTSELVHAYNTGTIDGFFSSQAHDEQTVRLRSTQYEIPSLKYYAVFLNKSAQEAFQYPEVRAALSAALDRQELVLNIFRNHADPMNGALPPALHIPQTTITLDTPENILTHAGWARNEQTQTWEKKVKNKIVSLTGVLSVPDNEPLRSIASNIIQQWERAGITITLDVQNLQTLTQDKLNTRNYQMLLFGNILLAQPDLFHFWNSTEKFYPGLNLSLYENATVDATIGALKRVGSDDPRRTQYLTSIAEQINKDMPALFLVSPHYLYLTKPSLRGITTHPLSLAQERFSNVSDWYIKTKRVFRD